MEIRTYQPEDFTAVLELFRQHMEYDAMTAELLHEKFFDDPNWLPEACFGAWENDQLLGFVQGTLRDIRGTRYGYVKLMAVHGEHRRKGIARALYARLEDFMRYREADVMRLYDVPLNYFQPGIDPRYTSAVCAAERLGFKRNGDTLNMLVSLQDQSWDVSSEIEQLRADGITVARATVEEREEVLDFLQGNWVLWRKELSMAYRTNPISVHIARLNGEVKAFSAFNGNNQFTGWFGPMLTHDDLRGKGIGAVLLKLCLQDMKDAGYSHSIIPWVGPIAFYAHYANAYIDRVFWRYEKKLK